MRRSGIILALVGWLILGASPPPPWPTGASVQTQVERDISNSLNGIAATLQNGAKSVVNSPPCGEGEDNRGSDLCAQWKAADAAERAATYAGWSILISVLGTGLLIWTLWETREAGRREHRAYVRVEPAPGGSVQPDKRICLPFNLINYGRTPALNLSVQSSVVVRAPEWDWADEAEISPELGLRPQASLHPDTPFLTTVEMDDPLPGPVYDAIMAGKAVVFARGTVRYRDVFRKWRETTFQVEFHGEDRGNGKDGKIRIAAKGNSFT